MPDAAVGGAQQAMWIVSSSERCQTAAGAALMGYDVRPPCPAMVTSGVASFST